MHQVHGMAQQRVGYFNAPAERIYPVSAAATFQNRYCLQQLANQASPPYFLVVAIRSIEV